ncbi:uncharacterized protein BDW70DRAFT_87602 [Aspergillus foveolatus]|uniref:uncharacterized protein n=1 Tax=Aspergillus foveolatus TaxID=210207 RepID=UPI003CCD1F36
MTEIMRPAEVNESSKPFHFKPDTRSLRFAPPSSNHPYLIRIYLPSSLSLACLHSFRFSVLSFVLARAYSLLSLLVLGHSVIHPFQVEPSNKVSVYSSSPTDTPHFQCNVRL